MFGAAVCGHCGKPGTKAVQIEPAGAAFKQTAICCSSCGAILGVTGYYDEGALLKKAEQANASLAQKVTNLEHQLNQILYVLQSR